MQLRRSPRVTHSRRRTSTTKNLERLSFALSELKARLRLLNGGSFPFPVEPALLAQTEFWPLATDAGSLNLVFNPSGTEGFNDLVRDAIEVDLGTETPVLISSLADVIRSKQAAGRPKDIAQLPALRQTLEVLRSRSA